MAGPVGSPYEGGLFNLILFVPENYPVSPPRARFLTKIFHPNIDREGYVHMDILSCSWSSVIKLRTLLLCIKGLLAHPNINNAIENVDFWKSMTEEATEQAKNWTTNYAMA
ncbi:uncharacterized protein LOC109597835 [Aethina tumida]|uniref:uncharacterized protein LOC109597798 n=1 Tax=Aethina tumida TaxID=116153 RepID=UPI0021488AB2|nr:uncharacterized protein LOC109597798 [Aethina tumida]XP_019869174.2 uncharacterized protein LOC126264133 [Aethina tumida]XP_049826478.1 uncharacterized protein LOC126266474 [Aethina tumida]XP_049826479.1 uncharacterized protein LOC109597835 [Aethina tumida]